MSEGIIFDRSKRYHLVSCGENASGEHVSGIVEGIPDPAKPDDPGRDGKDGTPFITGVGSAFWAALLQADIVWVERGFKRYWEYDPHKAARIRSGEATG
jgi:hypothetical protein